MFAECELLQLSTQSLNQSFETWIQNQRQADRVEKNLNALLKFIESEQVIEGSKYVEKLRDYFTAIKDEQGVKKANTTLEVLEESIMVPQVEEVIGFDLGHGDKERKDMASQANRLESLRSIREDLHSKLDSIRDQLKDMNISEDERSQIIDDFHTLDAILEALEKQHIRIAICGKVNAGKSSLANSLLQADVYKTDALQGTAVKANGSIKLDKWEIYDTPGIMSNLADDEEAKENIRRAHVRIFVINDQPYEPELELFRWATQLMPGLPTVVFFNKYDEFQERRQPRADKERILGAVKSRMQPFVKNVETDIIFGSASLFDPDSESFKRQPPPKDLMDWLYNQADYSSTLINVLDPAKQALTNIESNVLRVREQVARRILIEYAEGNATSALIPFSSVTLFPARLHSMNLTICEIMGVPPEKMQSAESISKVFWEGIWAAATTEALWSVAGLVLAPYTFGVSLMVTAYGTYREWDESQKRVLILGEALIQWIKSGYPNIRDAKAYLDQIRKKIESGDL
jgi:hypothetical protein